jgi:hypothetical protein
MSHPSDIIHFSKTSEGYSRDEKLSKTFVGGRNGNAPSESNATVKQECNLLRHSQFPLSHITRCSVEADFIFDCTYLLEVLPTDLYRYTWCHVSNTQPSVLGFCRPPIGQSLEFIDPSVTYDTSREHKT